MCSFSVLQFIQGTIVFSSSVPLAISVYSLSLSPLGRWTSVYSSLLCPFIQVASVYSVSLFPIHSGDVVYSFSLRPFIQGSSEGAIVCSSVPPPFQGPVYTHCARVSQGASVYSSSLRPFIQGRSVYSSSLRPFTQWTSVCSSSLSPLDPGAHLYHSFSFWLCSSFCDVVDASSTAQG